MTFTVRITTHRPTRVSVHPNQSVRDDSNIAAEFQRYPGLRALTQDFGSTVITWERED